MHIKVCMLSTAWRNPFKVQCLPLPVTGGEGFYSCHSITCLSKLSLKTKCWWFKQFPLFTFGIPHEVWKLLYKRQWTTCNTARARWDLYYKWSTVFRGMMTCWHGSLAMHCSLCSEPCHKATADSGLGNIDHALLAQKRSANVRWERSQNVFMESFLNVRWTFMLIIFS